MITTVTIGGAPIPSGTVLAEVTVLHGRDQVAAPPTPSSATIVVEVPEGPMPTWLVGDTLALDSADGPVFTGRVTDVGLVHLTKPSGEVVGRFTITGAGPVAALGTRTVGDEPWPAEAGTARASRILTLAEVPYVVDGAADQVVLARDVDSRPARDLLADLAASTGAAVVDLPDGRVVYQPMVERARPVHPFPWSDFPDAMTWDDFDPAMTWADFDSWTSSDSEFPLAIPASAVLWEPTWTSSQSTIVNHVRVGYGPKPDGAEQPWTELIDQASIDRHGRRYVYTGTQLQDLTDAQAYTSWTLTTRANPEWRFSDITVELARLDPELRAQVLALTCGRHITVGPVPNPAPAIVAEGIVEGWTYVIWGDAGVLHERITLRLSALLESLAVPAWSDYPAAYQWDHHPAYLMWADLTEVPA